jgi:hypothetical protein
MALFEFLQLMRPNLGKPAPRGHAGRLRMKINERLALPTPLVAYDLPWCERPPEVACFVADRLGALGIAVAGMRSEFFQTGDETQNTVPDIDLAICPYRPERYGLQTEDLRAARIVDVRLAQHRDHRGLPIYSAATMRRWDRRAARMADRDMRSFGELESLAWPPDVAEASKLSTKVAQLRQLAPRAVISLSIDAHRALFDLPLLLRAHPDLITLRADTWPVTRATALVELLTHTLDAIPAATRADEAAGTTGGEARPAPPQLVLVPPTGIDELDVIKLIALGVRLVAIDGWCRDLIAPHRHRQTAAEWAAANLGVRTDAVASSENIDVAALQQRIATLRNWLEAAGASHLDELSRSHLATYGDRLAGVRTIVSGVTNATGVIEH